MHTLTLADSYYLMIYISLLLAPIAYRAVECDIWKDVLGFFQRYSRLYVESWVSLHAESCRPFKKALTKVEQGD